MSEWVSLRRGLLAVAGLVVVALFAWWVERLTYQDRGYALMLRCLVIEKGVAVESPRDPIARSADRGWARTSIETNGVTIAVSSSEESAERIVSAYRSVVGDLGARLELRGRNVFLWDRPPSPTQRQNLYDCTY
ncbi:MAG TPA: hypothetical protein VM184_09055 [Gaiellaceae bacterium]|nr:hypothetical protein [Gaiellaceae bacterium]